MCQYRGKINHNKGVHKLSITVRGRESHFAPEAIDILNEAQPSHQMLRMELLYIKAHSKKLVFINVFSNMQLVLETSNHVIFRGVLTLWS